MPKFKKLLYILAVFIVFKFIATMGAASNAGNSDPLLAAINSNIGLFSAFVVLVVVFFALLPFSKKRKANKKLSQDD